MFKPKFKPSSVQQLTHSMVYSLLVCLFLLYCSVALAENNFRVFQTQQAAQSLIDIIKPLYGDKIKISARNNSLVVKATPAVLNEIEKLLAEFDKPLHNLLIEVSSSLEDSSDYQQNELEGQLNTGKNSQLNTGSVQQNNPNVSIRYGKNGSVIKTTHTRRSSSRDNPQTYKIRTIEGQWAYIQTGQKVPYYSTATPYTQHRLNTAKHYNKHYYPGMQTSLEMVDVTSGLEVFPLLNGEQVTLKVRPRNQSMDKHYSGRINSRSMETVITGRLGEWIFLGAANNEEHKQSNGLTHSTKRYSTLNSNYRIKVTIIN